MALNVANPQVAAYLIVAYARGSNVVPEFRRVSHEFGSAPSYLMVLPQLVGLGTRF